MHYQALYTRFVVKYLKNKTKNGSWSIILTTKKCVSKMHDNRMMLYFIETGKLGANYPAVNHIYLYKLPITWISLYVLLTTILIYL